MFRFLIFLLVVLGLGVLFAWLADNPGLVFLKWDWLAAQMGRPGEEIGISLTIVFIVLVAIVFVSIVIWSIIRTLLGAPSMLSRFFDNRKREKGYKALSQGLIAASSGDASTARKLTKESKKLLGSDPLVALLGTQTAILEGKRDEARENFKTMLSDDSTKMVALRGLFLEAERQGAPEAARHYAEEAAKTAPSLPWAGNAKLRYAAGDGDWDAAIKTLESNRSAGLIDKIAAKRQRAVLLTGKAMAKEDKNPDYALKLAKEAHKLAKDLVPAATTFARVSTRLGDPKTATKIVEAAWKEMPHPELAEAHGLITSGESVQDRLERAKKLAKLTPTNPEGNMALAMAAIDATEWQLARETLEPVLTSRPTERAYLLMADIEEGQHGDKGRMRDWLARALRAPADPAWVAGNHVSEEWLPVSPIDGAIDAFEWKVPVQQLGNTAAPIMTLEELKQESTPVDINQERTPNDESETEVEDAVVIDGSQNQASEADTQSDQNVEETKASEQKTVKEVTDTVAAATAAVAASTMPASSTKNTSDNHSPEPAEDKIEEAEQETVPEPQNDNQPEVTAETPVDTASKSDLAEDEGDQEKEETKETLADSQPSVETPSDDESPEMPVMPHNLAADTKQDNQENTVEFPLKRRPDDPGPHPDKEPPKKGFKLF